MSPLSFSVTASGDDSAPLPTLYLDADGCPVKEEAYRVARRYKLDVVVVANRMIFTPREENIRFQLVAGDPDAADDWIAEHVGTDDIVVTPDIPLAYRCVHAGARVITPRGRVHDHESIGSALAQRDLMTQLRDQGIEMGGGPPPFGAKPRQRFLQRLDEVVQSIKRGG